jgi:hypothetical protein
MTKNYIIVLKWFMLPLNLDHNMKIKACSEARIILIRTDLNINYDIDFVMKIFL